MSIARWKVAPLAAALAAILFPGSAAAADGRVVSRTVGRPAAPVPASFAGFSIEYWSLADYLGTPGAPNTPFIQLLRTLGENGVGTPTLHFGGNSADETWWNPGGRPRPAGVTSDLTPASLETLRAVSAQSGARLVLGGNLAIADPQNAVSFVQAASAVLPPGAFQAYEIGNEPDLYGRSVTFKVGDRVITRIQRRPANYDVPQYLPELDGYVGALIAARGAGWPELAVGSFARLAWQVQAGAVLDHIARRAAFFEAHSYPLNRCRARSPSRARWRRKLLGSPGLLPVLRMTQLVRAVRPRGAAVRLSELNTATCGGAAGVSDSFAAALWSTDVLFGLAQAGVSGVNFHSWTGSVYAPISFLPGPGGPVAQVRPLLYGMLLFDRAVANRARLLRVKQRRTDPLKVWATRDSKGTVRVVVINKDSRRARVVRLRLSRGLHAATVERLRARSPAARSRVTFAGRSFEHGGFDGRLHGRARRERLEPRGRFYTLRVPGASAALLSARMGAAR